MPFEKVNGLQVYYEVHGEGEVMVLLHHGFGSAKIWSGIYPQFVAHGFKVLMYDRRGFGRSEGGDDFQDFYESDRYRPESVEEMRVLKERLGIGECHIVGQCEGGVVGVDYSVKYPGEMTTLTAASTQCYSEVPMTELNAAKLVSKFAYLQPQLQVKVVDWHGKDAQSRYDQFAKYGGAYGTSFLTCARSCPWSLAPLWCSTLTAALSSTSNNRLPFTGTSLGANSRSSRSAGTIRTSSDPRTTHARSSILYGGAPDGRTRRFSLP